MKKPRIVYVERGVITDVSFPGRSGRAVVGYTRADAPAATGLLTKEHARLAARRLGAVATFRRIP